MSSPNLTYPSGSPLENVKVVAEDTVLWVSPAGNDGNGDGSASAPYQTLSRAMQVAREYVITGRAILTVRLMEGEYTLTDPVDLYHPQGANLVVEGDPAALKQRTLWRIEGYRWSPFAFAGRGHTAHIRLFNSAALIDAENHGFTSSDSGQYFAITNSACSARSGYYTRGNASGTGGIYSTQASTYDPYFWGDRFFSHGYSHDEGSGILGMGRISEVAGGTTMEVEFHNLNYDGRCPVWQTDGGIANSVTWAGVLNNFPETQYSEPNGYYGNPDWTTEDGSDTYPVKPNGVRHISPDPHTISTYPVRIRGQYSGGLGSVYLKDGSLRALRNLCFVSSESVYTSGSTASVSGAITLFSHQNRWVQTNGMAIALENATIGMRHVGVIGAGTAISAVNSRILKYSQTTIDTDTPPYGAATPNQTERFAEIGSLDNCPILCTAHCQNGIVAKGSVIDFSDGSGINSEYQKDFRESSVHIGARSKGIALFGSTLRSTSVNVELSALVPNFKFDAYVPVFPGFTLEGSGGGFVRSASQTSFFYDYPLVTAILTLAGGVTHEIGHVNWVEKSAVQTVTELDGITSGVTYINSVAPAYWEKYTFYGLKTSEMSLPLVTANDVKSGITLQSGFPLNGGTLSVDFNGSVDGSVPKCSFHIGRNSAIVKNDEGTTFGVLGIGGVNLGANLLQSFSSYGAPDTYIGNVYDDRTSGLQAYDGSSVMVEKALCVTNGGVVPVEVAKRSSLIVGDSMVSSNPSVSSQTSGQTETLFGNFNFTTGAICITGYCNSAVYCWDNSNAIIGTLFTKHPVGMNCFVEHDLSGGHSKIMKLDQGSNAVVGSLYSLLTIGNSSVVAQNSTDTATTVGKGLWKGLGGIGYGFMPFDAFRLNGYLLAERNSSLILELEAGNKVFHFDGGSPVWTGNGNLPRNTSLITAKGNSSILVGNCQESSVEFEQANKKTKFTSDTRQSSAQRLSTRSTGINTTIYGTSGISRAWAGEAGASTTFVTNDLNIGNYSFMLSQTDGIGSKDLPPLHGITYCSSFSGFSKIIGI
jgi:hypothetical protein